VQLELGANRSVIVYNLIAAMLPKKVADDLRMGRPVHADIYENCTIYFSDIVGFTTIAGKLAAHPPGRGLKEVHNSKVLSSTSSIGTVYTLVHM